MRKHLLMAIAFLGLSLGLGTVGYSAEIQHVDPPFWWVGMKNHTLQILFHGPKIAENEVSVKYGGVTIKDVVKTENPNYIFLYLDIAAKAKPGKVDITFSGKDGKTVYSYELKERSKKPGAQGFTTEDVLYLITPDANFERLFGARAQRKRWLYNGMIKCSLYMYFPQREHKAE